MAYLGDIETAEVCLKKTDWYQEMLEELQGKLLVKLRGVSEVGIKSR